MNISGVVALSLSARAAVTGGMASLLDALYARSSFGNFSLLPTIRWLWRRAICVANLGKVVEIKDVRLLDFGGWR